MTTITSKKPAAPVAKAAFFVISSFLSTKVTDAFAPSPFMAKHPSQSSNKFQSDKVSFAIPHFHPTHSKSSLSSTTNDDDGDEEARRLKEKALQYRQEAEKLKLSLGIQKIEALQSEIRELMQEENVQGSEEKWNQLNQRVEDLVRSSVGKEEAEVLLSSLSSNGGGTVLKSGLGDVSSSSVELAPLTDDELKAAVELLKSLPTPVKETLAAAAGYLSYEYITDMEEWAQKLYKNKDITAMELRRLYFQSFSPVFSVEDELEEEDYEIRGMQKLLDSIQENKTMAMELFPRLVQNMEDDVLPKEEDAQVVFKLLDQTTFMASEKPLRVKGGYLIRGLNKRKSAGELLEALDSKLEKESPRWMESFQLNFVELPTDADTELTETAILITPNKFIPEAPAALNFGITAASLFFSFVYCINTFGGNEVVMERLKEAAASGAGNYELTWFNDLLVPLLATLGVAQGLHELGHLLVAWSNKIKVTPSTVLPSQALPYLSFQNRLKTSPKNYDSLFDLAFAGPISGLAFSFVALLYGLELTTTIDQSAAQLLPSLSVGFLSQSTLGATLVDLVLGGGDGILLQQELGTPIPLHPVAIGGFLGIMINALDLVPLGSTDGGRMSQAVFGRIWHLTFSSAVFLVLLFTSFTMDSQGIFLGYLLIYSFTQRDMEIPCRNEIDKVELPRAAAAIVSWLIAVLVLVPLR